MLWTTLLVSVLVFPWVGARISALILSIILRKRVSIRRFGFLSLYDFSLRSSSETVSVARIRFFFPFTFHIDNVLVTSRHHASSLPSKSPSKKAKKFPLALVFFISKYIPAHLIFKLSNIKLIFNFTENQFATLSLSNSLTDVQITYTSSTDSTNILANSTCSLLLNIQDSYKLSINSFGFTFKSGFNDSVVLNSLLKLNLNRSDLEVFSLFIPSLGDSSKREENQSNLIDSEVQDVSALVTSFLSKFSFPINVLIDVADFSTTLFNQIYCTFSVLVSISLDSSFSINFVLNRLAISQINDVSILSLPSFECNLELILPSEKNNFLSTAILMKIPSLRANLDLTLLRKLIKISKPATSEKSFSTTSSLNISSIIKSFGVNFACEFLDLIFVVNNSEPVFTKWGTCVLTTSVPSINGILDSENDSIVIPKISIIYDLSISSVCSTHDFLTVENTELKLVHSNQILIDDVSVGLNTCTILALSNLMDRPVPSIKPFELRSIIPINVFTNSVNICIEISASTTVNLQLLQISNGSSIENLLNLNAFTLDINDFPLLNSKFIVLGFDEHENLKIQQPVLLNLEQCLLKIPHYTTPLDKNLLEILKIVSIALGVLDPVTSGRPPRSIVLSINNFSLEVADSQLDSKIGQINLLKRKRFSDFSKRESYLESKLKDKSVAKTAALEYKSRWHEKEASLWIEAAKKNLNFKEIPPLCKIFSQKLSVCLWEEEWFSIQSEVEKFVANCDVHSEIFKNQLLLPFFAEILFQDFSIILRDYEPLIMSQSFLISGPIVVGDSSTVIEHLVPLSIALPKSVKIPFIVTNASPTATNIYHNLKIKMEDSVIRYANSYRPALELLTACLNPLSPPSVVQFPNLFWADKLRLSMVGNISFEILRSSVFIGTSTSPYSWRNCCFVQFSEFLFDIDSSHLQSVHSLVYLQMKDLNLFAIGCSDDLSLVTPIATSAVPRQQHDVRRMEESPFRSPVPTPGSPHPKSIRNSLLFQAVSHALPSQISLSNDKKIFSCTDFKLFFVVEAHSKCCLLSRIPKQSNLIEAQIDTCCCVKSVSFRSVFPCVAQKKSALIAAVTYDFSTKSRPLFTPLRLSESQLTHLSYHEFGRFDLHTDLILTDCHVTLSPCVLACLVRLKKSLTTSIPRFPFMKPVKNSLPMSAYTRSVSCRLLTQNFTLNIGDSLALITVDRVRSDLFANLNIFYLNNPNNYLRLIMNWDLLFANLYVSEASCHALVNGILTSCATVKSLNICLPFTSSPPCFALSLKPSDLFNGEFKVARVRIGVEKERKVCGSLSSPLATPSTRLNDSTRLFQSIPVEFDPLFEPSHHLSLTHPDQSFLFPPTSCLSAELLICSPRLTLPEFGSFVQHLFISFTSLVPLLNYINTPSSTFSHVLASSITASLFPRKSLSATVFIDCPQVLITSTTADSTVIAGSRLVLSYSSNNLSLNLSLFRVFLVPLIGAEDNSFAEPDDAVRRGSDPKLLHPLMKPFDCTINYSLSKNSIVLSLPFLSISLDKRAYKSLISAMNVASSCVDLPKSSPGKSDQSFVVDSIALSVLVDNVELRLLSDSVLFLLITLVDIKLTDTHDSLRKTAIDTVASLGNISIVSFIEEDGNSFKKTLNLLDNVPYVIGSELAKVKLTRLPSIGGVIVFESFDVIVVPVEVRLSSKLVSLLTDFLNISDENLVDDDILNYFGSNSVPSDLDLTEDDVSDLTFEDLSESTTEELTPRHRRGSESAQSSRNQSFSSDFRPSIQPTSSSSQLPLSSRYYTFHHVRISPLQLKLSYKGSKSKNLRDFNNVRIHLPQLSYSNKTLLWSELGELIKHEILARVIAQTATGFLTDKISKVLRIGNSDSDYESDVKPRRRNKKQHHPLSSAISQTEEKKQLFGVFFRK
ncbi:hypothetical protein RCL1_005582 [Eukaryota sp. TZLM3-RCL]